jgi:hypothetical protein
MKQLLFFITSFLSFLPLQAQDVWKEGTQWTVEYITGETYTYTLEAPEEIDGKVYLPLVYDSQTLGYVRPERGDTVVHARISTPDGLSDELLLYDFGTFEPGTQIQYSVADTLGESIELCTETIEAAGLSYYPDVIVEGDLLPCYDGILFKVGCLGGPFELLEDCIFNFGDFSPIGDKPKRKNISHTVLRLNGRNVSIDCSGIVTPTRQATAAPGLYDLSGRQLPSVPKKGIYIQNGRKRVSEP